MSKMFVAIHAFSSVSLTACYEGLDLFLNNPRIKLLSNPSVRSAYPGDDTNYEDLMKALAALQEPIYPNNAKDVLKEHAPKLFERVEAAEYAFNRVLNSIDAYKSGDLFFFVANVGLFLDDYYLVGKRIHDHAMWGHVIHNLHWSLSDEEKIVAD